MLTVIFSFLFGYVNATIYYVDDASNTNDVWTPAAVGNNTNNGTSVTTPKATVANVLSTYVLSFGDIIYVDAGSYTETAIDIGTSDDGSASGYVTICGASNTLTIFSTLGTDNTFDFATANVQYVKIMNLKVTKNTAFYNTVNFAGTGINNIWFENCVLTQAANNEVVYGDNPNASACSAIKFNNCTITNTNTSTDADGIELIDNFDNLVITNNTFNISGGSNGLYVDNATDIYTSTGGILSGNTINMTHATSGNVRALIMRGKTASSIYSNTINNSSTSTSCIGISLEDHNDGTLIPNLSSIYSNTINTYGTGINIEGYDATNVATTIDVYGNSITISSSAASNIGVKLTYAGSSGNPIKVYSNRIVSGNHGISLVSDVSFCQIYNNYVSNNAFGFYNASATNDNVDLYYNSFYGSTNGAYIAQLSSTDNLKNNIFYTTSASGTDYALEIISNATLATSMDYNLYYVPNGAKAGYFGAAYTTLTNWKAVDKVTGASLGEENGQTGSPVYDNGASNDLDINSASSKAYKLGTPISSYTTDIYSTSRDPLTPNIGAFENTTLLPVELISFDAISDKNIVRLNWVTLTEWNNDLFIVEKSKDGKSFQFVQDLDGAGNTMEITNYYVEDKTPYSGISYYRLRQIDFDGKETTYLRSVFIQQEIGIYPNPNQGSFFIEKVSEFSNISIYDNMGKEILFSSRKMNDGIEINLSSAKEGVYFIQIKTDLGDRMEKITVLTTSY